MLGSIVFGPNWDKRTPVGAGDEGTFIPVSVYRHEILPLLQKIEELEARIAKLEHGNGGARQVVDL